MPTWPSLGSEYSLIEVVDSAGYRWVAATVDAREVRARNGKKLWFGSNGDISGTGTRIGMKRTAFRTGSIHASNFVHWNILQRLVVKLFTTLNSLVFLINFKKNFINIVVGKEFPYVGKSWRNFEKLIQYSFLSPRIN